MLIVENLEKTENRPLEKSITHQHAHCHLGSSRCLRAVAQQVLRAPGAVWAPLSVRQPKAG